MADSALVTYSYYSPTRGGSQDPNIGVIHSIESPLRPGYAKTLVGPAYFGSSAAGVSIHYLVDPVDTCQGLPETTVGFHVGGGNKGTIGIEQAGYARFSSAEWNTADGQRQMARLSALMADISRRRPKIALRWLTDAQLRAAWGNPGVTGGWVTHDQMRRVIGGTTHYDPWNAPNATTAWPSGSVMAAASGGTPTLTGDWFDMATLDDLKKAVTDPAVLDAIAGTVWMKTLRSAAARDELLQAADKIDFLYRSETFTDEKGNVTLPFTKSAASFNDTRGMSSRLGVVVDDSTGAWYAVAPGIFWHLPNFDFVNAARAAGLLAEFEHHTDSSGIEAVRVVALSPNGEIYKSPTTYTVAAGDTLSKIATALGVTVEALAAANNISNPDAITVGQVLNVPKA